MKITTQDYNVEDEKRCECGYNFDIHDIDGLVSIDNHGFYSNAVKYCSHIHCPQCYKETVLLLKQKGQTWDILGIATPKTLLFEEPKAQEPKKEIKVEPKIEPKVENKTENIAGNELICPVCKKVCKSRIGLNAHMKTHNK